MGEGLEEGLVLELERTGNTSVLACEDNSVIADIVDVESEFLFETESIPKINVNIDTFTDLDILESARRAVEILREEYGIFVDYDINNFSLTIGASELVERVEAIIDLFGVEKIIVDDYTDIKNDLANIIVRETLRILGRSLEELDSVEALPFNRNEPPRMASAVLI